MVAYCKGTPLNRIKGEMQRTAYLSMPVHLNPDYDKEKARFQSPYEQASDYLNYLKSKLVELESRMEAAVDAMDDLGIQEVQDFVESYRGAVHYEVHLIIDVLNACLSMGMVWGVVAGSGQLDGGKA